MNMYRRVGDQVATIEARDLAEQLVAWHDAMVKHVRVLSARDDTRCGEDCPHDEAALTDIAIESLLQFRRRRLTNILRR